MEEISFVTDKVAIAAYAMAIIVLVVLSVRILK